MKKAILFLLIISAFSQIKASDTLTVRQVFNFNVGDTFDYHQHFAGDLAGPGYVVSDDYQRIIITGKNTTVHQDTIFYTYSQKGINTLYTPYYFKSVYTNLDSTILYYDYIADSIAQTDSFFNFSTIMIDNINTNSYKFVLASHQPHLSTSDRDYTGSRTYVKGLGAYHLMDSSNAGNPDNPSQPFSRYITLDLLYYSNGINSFGTPIPANVLTGIADIETANITSLPNPTTGTLHLSISELNSTYQFILTDLMGRELISQPITQSETTLDIANLASGLYTWRLASDNATIKTGKLIKE